MLLRGVEPPARETVRNDLMTRMFMMQEAKSVEMMHAIGMLLIATNSETNQTIIDNVNKVLEVYQESVGYQRWSRDNFGKAEKQKRSDAEILEKVSRLGDVKLGDHGRN